MKKISEMTQEELEKSLLKKNNIQCEECHKRATSIKGGLNLSGKGYCIEHEKSRS